jgi:hypothetical protein
LGGGWKIIARLKQPSRGFEPPPDSLPMAFQPKSKYRAYIEDCKAYIGIKKKQDHFVCKAVSGISSKMTLLRAKRQLL